MISLRKEHMTYVLKDRIHLDRLLGASHVVSKGTKVCSGGRKQSPLAGLVGKPLQRKESRLNPDHWT